MPLSYAQNKVHIYKWVANNREKHNANNSKSQKKRHIYLKQTKIFRNMAINLI